MKFDALFNPYPSQRMTTYARKGMVATAQPLAAQAGIEILKKGGNAIDAAIATAACLTVLEPNSNSIGADTFAIVWYKGKLHGLNASGPAPKAISIQSVKAAGYHNIPNYGMLPVTVPGTPAAWAGLSERFGQLPLTEVLSPAIDYAENGYPVSPTIGKYWDDGFQNIRALKGEAFTPWLETFAPKGRAPRIGEMWRSPDHAKTLSSIAETGAQSFYEGELADKIDAFFRKYGGFLRKEDLASYKLEWVDPININYGGYDIWEIPPNGQGIIALMALNILKGFKFTAKDTLETYHKQIEAVKLAFIDGLKYITDPKHMKLSASQLLSEPYSRLRRELITEEALMPQAGEPFKGDTVYLSTADGEGNMVSLIQSHAGDFGSGIVIPGTGICMQNRGTGFSLDPSHHNALAPGKKTYHTIIPGFITKGEQAIGPFGVMCGMIQPQAHVQLVMNLIDFHLNPQATLDAPRWRWIKENIIEVEPGFPDHIAQALVRKGHIVQRATDSGMFGRGQIILRDPESGVLAGGTEPRADGEVAAW
ncbi:gamma-glutamyltranspeptidase/glutathione hydrolase [Pullulanibacillus pueri]|uniref:Gamma-glutamyltransferase n=1 Tax=Pullulanibacillus pueri TaxID=1437324 RepID=A0A8J3ELW0_9BACL|nr:gamma-glutamyltransferase family protein [Pullulanibacillus pueri]MBM7682654.1 gamma-glutamyltranspeptidase/glutathione hydrolase [Pullulanibacillus pueri]GGH82664.1 gamma-glutamyltransferase [Pullulanibacillus pueri]